MTRLFVALELPALVKQHLLMLAGGVPGARWLEEDQMHLTLRFIGEVDGAVMADVTAALSSVEAEPFEVMLAGVGHFPPRGTPRTLWVGVVDNPKLMGLRTRIESALAGTGAGRDSRKFFPHVALARLREPKMPKVAEFLSKEGQLLLPMFDLITEAELAVDALIDVAGRAAIVDPRALRLRDSRL